MKNKLFSTKQLLLLFAIMGITLIAYYLFSVSEKPAAVTTPTATLDSIRGNPHFAEPNPKPIEEMLKTASAERGRSVAHICNDCHSFDEGGPNRLGPNLFGIFGSNHAHSPTYSYSKDLLAMRDKIWTAENLNKWLMGPRVYAPGTKMVYPGLSKAQDRADIIAYIKTMK